MIFLTNDILNKKIEFISLIYVEKDNINTYIESQHNLKNIFLNHMQRFAFSEKDIDTDYSNKVMDFLEKSKTALSYCNENINDLEHLLTLLNDLLKKLEIDTSTFFNENNVQTYSEYLNNIYLTYNKTYTILANSTAEMHTFLTEFTLYSDFNFSKHIEKLDIEDLKSNNNIAESKIENIQKELNLNLTPNIVESVVNQVPTSNIEEEVPINSNTENIIESVPSTEVPSSIFANEVKEEIKPEKNIIEELAMQKELDKSPIRETTDDLDLKEKTLIISEIQKKIILPYTLNELNVILATNPTKYYSIKEIIEKKYTLSIDAYKNTAISRFKEAFKLMKNRENSSIAAAFDLGMELLFSYNLHPAIITACKTLDELDIYLDYLDNNEVYKFDCFDIIFEVSPIASKRKKSDFLD